MAATSSGLPRLPVIVPWVRWCAGSGLSLGAGPEPGASAFLFLGRGAGRFTEAPPSTGPYFGSTVVGRGVSIGANATVVCGIELAPWSMVAAGAVVTRSTRPYELVAGNPARHHGWVCRCGAVVSRDRDPPAGLADTRCEHTGG